MANATNDSQPLFSLCSTIVVNTSSSECQQIRNTQGSFVIIHFLLAIIATVAMQFIQRRKKMCLNCCSGRPGILIPVNLLTHSKYRLIYVAIFGSMSSEFADALVGNVAPSVSLPDPYSQQIVSLMLTLLITLLVSIGYYPIFASVDTPIPIVGHCIGTVFAAIRLVGTLIQEYIKYSGCSSGCQAEDITFVVQFLSDTPIVLLDLFLFLWFLGMIGYDIYQIVTMSKFYSDYEHLDDHLKKVKHRLKRSEIEHSKAKEGLKKFLLMVYPYDPGFKFPLRFLAGMAVTLVIVYQLSFRALYLSIQLTASLDKSRRELFQIYDEYQRELEGNATFETLLERFRTPFRIAIYIVVIIAGAIATTIIVGTIFCAVQIFLTFRSVSTHLHHSTQGKQSSFLPGEYPTLHRSLMASFRYPGYLIAYSFWAWAVYIGLLMLIGIIVVIAGVALYFFYEYLGPQIAVLILGFAWTQGLYWSQFFLTKIFLIEKAYPDSEHMVLKNRRVMHWLTYILVFQNAFIGMFSTFIRLIMSLAFGLLTFSRLDRLLLLRGLESYDAAHRTYIGMIYLDYVQNNAILNVFCHLLTEHVRLKKIREGEIVEEVTDCCQPRKRITSSELVNVEKLEDDEDGLMRKDPVRPRVSQKAYNRWRVAYTLIRNEELIDFTKANLVNEQIRKKSLREKMGHMNDLYTDEYDDARDGYEEIEDGEQEEEGQRL